MKNKTIFNISFSGICIALCLILPFLTGQIPEIGSMLCPMHIPVIICGMICGYKYGLIVGFISPILRSLIFTMPPFYPTALAMSFELLTYGLLSGLLLQLLKKTKLNIIPIIFISLIISMIGGRVVWGIVRFIMSLFDQSNVFNMNIFIAGAFVTAWPGILLQLLLIPTLIITLYKTNIIKE